MASLVEDIRIALFENAGETLAPSSAVMRRLQHLSRSLRAHQCSAPVAVVVVALAGSRHEALGPGRSLPTTGPAPGRSTSALDHVAGNPRTTLERWAHHFLRPYDVAAQADHGQKQVTSGKIDRRSLTQGPITEAVVRGEDCAFTGRFGEPFESFSEPLSQRPRISH